jgi:hypothetical protein
LSDHAFAFVVPLALQCAQLSCPSKFEDSAVTSAVLHERRLGSLRWITASGESGAVFRALGHRVRHEIAEILDRYPERTFLQDYAITSEGARVIRGIVSATKEHCQAEWEELVSMADGASVPIDDLLLFNLRGDLGPTTTGCTDLAWCGERSLLAHNEDGLPMFDGRCVLLTLAIDDEVPITAYWYPGLLPSNALVIYGTSLVWSMDHLGVAVPAIAPGRYFTARKAQRAPTVEAAIAIFEKVSSAGGFAYTIGQVASKAIVSFEVAAGHVSQVALAGDKHQLMWHANNMRYLGDVSETADLESLARSSRLAVLADELVSADCFSLLDLLTQPSDWPGLYRSAIPPDPLMTLCSMACDLGSGTITVIPRGGKPVTLSLTALGDVPR